MGVNSLSCGRKLFVMFIFTLAQYKIGKWSKSRITWYCVAKNNVLVGNGWGYCPVWSTTCTINEITSTDSAALINLAYDLYRKSYAIFLFESILFHLYIYIEFSPMFIKAGRDLLSTLQYVDEVKYWVKLKFKLI